MKPTIENMGDTFYESIKELIKKSGLELIQLKKTEQEKLEEGKSEEEKSEQEKAEEKIVPIIEAKTYNTLDW